MLAAVPWRHRKKGCALLERFSTTIAIVPSGFKNAVVVSVSMVDELMIRLAPGRMNFEKWPI